MKNKDSPHGPLQLFRRRDLLALIGGAGAWASLRPARSANKPRLIASLNGAAQASAAVDMDAFLAGMRDFGYVEGSSFTMTYRYADGDYQRMPALATELMQLHPDLVFAPGGTPAALAIKAISATVPIVSPTLYDEVAAGLAASVARPGRNVTGMEATLASLDAKNLELAHDVLPNVRRIGLIVSVASRDYEAAMQVAQAAAVTLGLTLTVAKVRAPANLPGAFEELQAAGSEAVVVTSDSLTFSERAKIVGLAAKSGLPDFHGFRQSVEAGGLMCYGINNPANFRRAAYFVDRIWKGTPPGELPIEFPTKLELVINQRRAKELGITIPQNVIVRADEVIE